MKSFPPDFASPKGVLLALDLSKGIDLKLSMPFASAEEATKVKGVAEIGMAEPKKQAEALGFGDFVKTLSLTTTDKDFVISWILNSDETMKMVEKVVAMAGPMMGGVPMPTEAPEAPAPTPAPETK